MVANVVEIIVTGKNLATPVFAKAEAEAAGLRKSFLAIGTGIAIAGAAVAVESVKMASKFDAAMTRLHTQAGVSQGQIKGLSDAVLDLAGKVGESPNSLAEALFHVESAFESTGISSSKAMKMVETAAKGARIGGADLVSVTNALTAAVAANIPGVENMDEAMGSLNATVGVGDMKMQDLADAFGTGMVAVVKGYGLSITDVGAALATFGDNNIRGAQAGTQLRMAVQALAVPVKTAKADLERFGMTNKTLAEDMQHGGLNAAITDLKAHMDAAGISAVQQGQIITEMFGKRAGTGVNILIGQYDRLQSKYPALEEGAAGFGEAWDKTSKTTAQRLADLKASFEALMIHIGQKLSPAVGKAADALSKLVGFISDNLDVIGPLTIAVVGFVTALLTIRTAIAAWKTMREAMIAMNATTGVLGAVTLGLTAIYLIANKFGGTPHHNIKQIETDIKELGQSGKVTGDMLSMFGDDFEKLNQQIKVASDTTTSAASNFKQFFTGDWGSPSNGKIAEAKASLDDMDGALADLVNNGQMKLAEQAFLDMSAATQKSGGTQDDLVRKLPKFEEAMAGVKYQNDITAESMGEFGQQAMDTKATLDEQAAAADGLKQAIEDLNDVNRGALDAMSDLQQAETDATKEVKKHHDALYMVNGQLGLQTQAARDAFKPLSDLAAKTDAAADAALRAGQSQDQANSIYNEGRLNLIALAEKEGLTKDQAKKLADQILKIPTAHNTKITADTSKASKKISDLKTSIRDLDGSVIHLTVAEAGATVTAAGLHVQGGTITRETGGIIGAAGGGPRSNIAWVGEHGPELVRLPYGSQVHSNPDSMRMAGLDGGGTGSLFNYGHTVGQGFVDGLRNAFASIKSVMDDLASKMKEYGKGIAKGFTDGVQASLPTTSSQAAPAAIEKAVAKTSTATKASASGFSAAADEIMNRIKSGKSFYEDLTYDGDSKNLDAQNEKLWASIRSAIKEIMSAHKAGKTIYEDFSFKGESANVRAINDLMVMMAKNPAGKHLLKANGLSLPGFAHGGIGGGLSWVGEHGPELVRLPYGSQVHSNQDSMRMVGEANRGDRRTIIEINAANNDVSKMLVEILKNAIRVRGGDVQVVLGK